MTYRGCQILVVLPRSLVVSDYTEFRHAIFEPLNEKISNLTNGGTFSKAIVKIYTKEIYS